MQFNERQQLEKEYYTWLKQKNQSLKIHIADTQIEDCPFTVISFLDEKGLLRSNIQEKEQKIKDFWEILKNQSSIPNEFVDTVNKNFWELF